MKGTKFLFLVAALVTLFAQPAHSTGGKNLITDGGFEGQNGQGGYWQFVGRVGHTLSPLSYEGAFAAEVVDTQPGLTGGPAELRGAGISNRFPVKASLSLVCSFAISYTLSWSAININVNTYKASGGFDGDYPLLVVFDTSTNGYQLVSQTITLPADAATAEVQFGVNSIDANGPYWDVLLDAFSCTQPANQ